ncbi:MAG TPA: DUF3175 domain-containing protein [Myxococcales bacterium]|nr:DUF3175 domain-containing protein [Myxococcales bacterium]
MPASPWAVRTSEPRQRGPSQARPRLPRTPRCTTHRDTHFAGGRRKASRTLLLPYVTAAGETIGLTLHAASRSRHLLGMAKKQKARRGRAGKRASGRYWSKRVNETSDALNLRKGVFKLPPKRMARSLKRSAEQSSRRKSAPLRSAMSMISFYENRAGRKLPPSRKRRIGQAKKELRRLFGKER